MDLDVGNLGTAAKFVCLSWNRLRGSYYPSWASDRDRIARDFARYDGAGSNRASVANPGHYYD